MTRVNLQKLKRAARDGSVTQPDVIPPARIGPENGDVSEWELLARIMNHVATWPSSNGPSASVALVDDSLPTLSMLQYLG